MFVGRLPYVLEKADVHHIFEPFGEILDIKLFRDSTTGKSKGAASVIFHLADLSLQPHAADSKLRVKMPE